MTAPAPTAGPSEATGTAPAGAPDATPASPAPSTGQAPAAPPVASTVDDLPDWAQKALKDARAEAAKTRVESKAEADARVKALLQAAGIETDETDPAKAADQIARERDEARSEVRSIKVERAIELSARLVDLMQPDGIHPNAQAQSRLLENVWPVLQPML